MSQKKNFPLAGKSDGWIGTGIYLKTGQTARFNATGTIFFGPFNTWPFSPDGELTKNGDGGAPAPGLTRNSLVARAGGGAVHIGTQGEITAERDAQLQVAANDNWPHDNDGYWMLTIEY